MVAEKSYSAEKGNKLAEKESYLSTKLNNLAKRQYLKSLSSTVLPVTSQLHPF